MPASLQRGRGAARGASEAREVLRSTAGGRAPILGAARFSALLRRHAGQGAESLLREVGRMAAEQGIRVCLVGGVVRDLLLERGCSEFDLVVEGDAAALAVALAERRGGIVTQFARFLTARVDLPDGRRVDLAAARRENYPHPAALPRVRPGGLDEDAWRRDLSINALAVRIDRGAFGRLRDLTGGLQDLARRRIRLLHELSLIDDPTRAFRAVRFAVRLGFELSPETVALIGVARRSGVFEQLSARRLGREVELILSGPRIATAVVALARYGLLGVLQPQLRLTAPTRRGLSRTEAALSRAAAWERNAAVEGWRVQLLVLAHSLAPPRRAELAGRLAADRTLRRLLGEAPEQIRSALHSLARRRRLSSGTVHLICSGLGAEALLAATALAPTPRVRRALLRYAERRVRLELDIDGNDLLGLGVAPGPAVAAGLQAAQCAWLEGRAPGREGQLRVALQAARSA